MIDGSDVLLGQGGPDFRGEFLVRLIEAAKADLKKRTARTPYVSPLPDNVGPPLDMSVT